jgi:hypothetical protein
MTDASIEPLLSTLTRDLDPVARQQAAQALGQTQDQRAVSGLIHALQDHDLDRRPARSCAGGGPTHPSSHRRSYAYSSRRFAGTGSGSNLDSGLRLG